ncbi:hypothetical protein JY651_16555 [Pyxidicoccus parkwayensis]|uniref:Uncharacterized protein n=1 Tax=Pyxidicoccus parkwayensis TaxID=2813578 RepID=A0ABX7P7G8_9BACT|nr:hypothetical protein [Pyxidicoccus parkwaysis]QSQ26438.1 hypothetical protein JY651_16555 [Pyxidicoccus parkwaysis]
MSGWFDDVMPSGEAQAEGVEPQRRRVAAPGQGADGRLKQAVVREPPRSPFQQRMPHPPIQTRPVPPRDDGGFFSGAGDVTADPFMGPASGAPADDGADSTGDGMDAQEPFQGEEPSGGLGTAEAESSGGGFFSAEADPFDVPVMASIEGGADTHRDAHQKRRDETYDTIQKVGETVAKVGAVVGVRNPEAGAIVGAVGVGIDGVAAIGRGVGAVIDDAYDRDDANLAARTKQDIDRMKNKAARDKVNKTPRGFSRITED